MFSESIGALDANQVEVVAIKLALEVFINAKLIDSLILQTGEVSLNKIFGEANGMADRLAKDGVIRGYVFQA
ncbi:hypothetical protein REPUB_Repub10bG0113600 [Reevesia pubescens]